MFLIRRFFGRPWLLAGLILFAVAAPVRLYLLKGIAAGDLLRGGTRDATQVTDEEGINVAIQLLEGRGFSNPFLVPTGPTAHIPPAFPVETSLIFVVFGTGERGAYARNTLNIIGYSLLIAMLPWASFFLGTGIFPGFISGALWAVFPIFRSIEVFRGRDEWLAAVVLLLLSLGAYRFCSERRASAREAAALGGAWGLLMYIHPSMALIMPLHLAIIAGAWRKHPGRGSPERAGTTRPLRFALITCAAFLAVISAWTVRNRLVMHSWIFMRDNAGMELHLANNEFARASLQDNMATEWYFDHHPTTSVAIAEDIARAGEIEYNRTALHQAIEWIRSHPRSFLKLTALRAMYFWADTPVSRITMLVRCLLSLAGLAGMVLMYRAGHRVPALLIAAIWIAYPLPYYLVQYANRYVAPVSFAILLPAGYTALALAINLRHFAGASFLFPVRTRIARAN